MLMVAIVEDDDLYWAAEKPPLDPALPKRKRVQLDEESLDDTVLTIKSGLSTKKMWKSALKVQDKGTKNTEQSKDSLTIASQATSISQLTKQVNEIKQTNLTFLACFDQLAEQMAALLAASQNSSNPQCPAGGHTSGSSRPPWGPDVVHQEVRTTALHVVHKIGNHPQWRTLLLPRMRQSQIQVIRIRGENL